MTATLREGFVFGGHQTFSFRQLWPYKAYHEMRQARAQGYKPFEPASAMLSMGVGANMVESIKFWGKAAGIITSSEVTTLGQILFEGTADSPALDPYCESPLTLWLLHWNLAAQPQALTALWFLFNKFNLQTFSKDALFAALQQFLEQQKEQGALSRLPSRNTLNRDLDTILRAYCPKTRGKGVLRKQVAELDNAEETADDPLRELGLITLQDDTYSFVRGNRPTLNNALFAYFLLSFWNSNAERLVSMDFNRIAYEAGSPGRVFKLDELSLGEHLQQLEDTTQGALRWSEQNGLRQVLSPAAWDQASRLELQHHLLKKAFRGHD